MRDYLYIPMGGNRGSTFQTYRNLMLTMLIGGLWHGAAWTFVAWGAYHGALLSVHRAWGRPWDALPTAVRQLGMFFFAVIGWVFFRSTDFGMAADLLRQMFVPTGGVLVPGLPLAAVLLAIAAWWGMRGRNPFELDYAWSPARTFGLVAAFAACLAIIAGSRSSPFLYFQF
jgi:alginate O-acetyltransferase complex protein AlgI